MNDLTNQTIALKTIQASKLKALDERDCWLVKSDSNSLIDPNSKRVIFRLKEISPDAGKIKKGIDNEIDWINKNFCGINGKDIALSLENIPEMIYNDLIYASNAKLVRQNIYFFLTGLRNLKSRQEFQPRKFSIINPRKDFFLYSWYKSHDVLKDEYYKIFENHSDYRMRYVKERKDLDEILNKINSKEMHKDIENALVVLIKGWDGAIKDRNLKMIIPNLKEYDQDIYSQDEMKEIYKKERFENLYKQFARFIGEIRSKNGNFTNNTDLYSLSLIYLELVAKKIGSAKAILERYNKGIDSKLNTEQIILRNEIAPDKIIETMHKIREAQVKKALNDYGYIAYLQAKEILGKLEDPYSIICDR